MCLPEVNSFSDITADVELQQSLQDAYSNVANVDLWVGGLAETPLRAEGSLLGELFQAIVVRQFRDLRDGDRFWHERYLSDEELVLVRGTTLADVIRNNTCIGTELQDNVFSVRR